MCNMHTSHTQQSIKMEKAKLDFMGNDTYNGEFSSSDEHIYGGEMIALAAKVALLSTTAPDKYLINSVHCYYIQMGKKGSVSYHVSRLKDGQRYCFRSVTGVQNNKPVVACLVSFKSVNDRGSVYLPHSSHSMPIVPGPNDAVPVKMISNRYTEFPGVKNIPLEINYCNPVIWELKGSKDKGYHPTPMEPRHSFWMKPTDKILTTEQNEHRIAMIFASDNMSLLITRRYPDCPILLSLDHCIHFHSDDIDFNNWHLFDQECVYSSSATITTGRIYSENGQLVASAIQQGIFFNSKL